MLNVKIARVPGTVVEVVLENNASVSDALTAAGIQDTSGYLMQLNGANCSVTANLNENDRITLAKGAKGNTGICVKVAMVPGTVKEVVIDGDTTVGAALSAAGITDTSGYLMQLNGASCSIASNLNENDRITLAKGAKGNAEVSVKVARVPGTVQEVMLAEGASVSDALSAAGIQDISGYLMQLNGANCSTNTIVGNCDRITLAKGAKGNA